MANPAVVRVVQPGVVRARGDSLVAGLLRWLRSLAGKRSAAVDAPLRAEARLSLGPKKSLVLVNCCGRRVLLGLSGDALIPLGEWPRQAERRTKRTGATRKEAAQ
jgi:flagellar biogenesis protein FliO